MLKKVVVEPFPLNIFLQLEHLYIQPTLECLQWAQRTALSQQLYIGPWALFSCHFIKELCNKALFTKFVFILAQLSTSWHMYGSIAVAGRPIEDWSSNSLATNWNLLQGPRQNTCEEKHLCCGNNTAQATRTCI